MVISEGSEYHGLLIWSNDRMKQKKRTPLSTAMTGCSWKTQFAKRHLVLHGNAPYVISVKTVKSAKEPAEAMTSVDLRYVLDGHVYAENKGLRK
jgi:hypothetical protein